MPSSSMPDRELTPANGYIYQIKTVSGPAPGGDPNPKVSICSIIFSSYCLGGIFGGHCVAKVTLFVLSFGLVDATVRLNLRRCALCNLQGTPCFIFIQQFYCGNEIIEWRQALTYLILVR